MKKTRFGGAPNFHLQTDEDHLAMIIALANLIDFDAMRAKYEVDERFEVTLPTTGRQAFLHMLETLDAAEKLKQVSEPIHQHSRKL